MIDFVQDPPMDLRLLGNSYARHRRAGRLKAGVVTFLFIGAINAEEPASARVEADPAAATQAKRLPDKYDPVASHLHALIVGTITSSLSHVDEHVAIFSVESGKEPRQTATGKRSLLPLYVMSFGVEPASLASYECTERSDSLYCTFMMKNKAQRPSFGLEFWVADGRISKILKWYNVPVK
jgi:hypothetical protein